MKYFTANFLSLSLPSNGSYNDVVYYLVDCLELNVSLSLQLTFQVFPVKYLQKIKPLNELSIQPRVDLDTTNIAFTLYGKQDAYLRCYLFHSTTVEPIHTS